MASPERDKKRPDKNHGLLVALWHPLRRRILRLMADGREVSPSELAVTLGQRLANVAYHVRVLTECGALKPVDERSVGGTTQRFYRWSLESEWAQAMLDEDEEESSKDKP